MDPNERLPAKQIWLPPFHSFQELPLHRPQRAGILDFQPRGCDIQSGNKNRYNAAVSDFRQTVVIFLPQRSPD